MSDVVAADRVPVAVHRAVAPIAHRSGRGRVPATTPPAFGRTFTIGLRGLRRGVYGPGRVHLRYRPGIPRAGSPDRPPRVSWSTAAGTAVACRQDTPSARHRVPYCP